MSPVIFAYFGPETVLPITSTIAAAAGVALMFGRQLRLVCKLAFQRIFSGPRRGFAAGQTPLPRAGRRVSPPPSGSDSELSASSSASTAEVLSTRVES